jgi:hypothetical protein
MMEKNNNFGQSFNGSNCDEFYVGALGGCQSIVIELLND